MTAIGGKTKEKKPTQPQFVVQHDINSNSYMKLVAEGDLLLVTWVGDPNSATKFDSKYNAKTRVRDIANVPDTRCFKELV